MTIAAGLAIGIAVATPVAAAAPDTPWLDTSKPAAERASSLLAASTQHQKYRWLNEQAANSPAVTEFRGITYPAQVEGTPTVVYTDGPDGVRFTTGVTAFPAPISFASGWDAALFEQKSAAQGAEAFDKGKNGVLGPGLASGRTPLSGRTPEYLGEDPLLTGTLAAAAITGLQGVEGKPVMADIKHYVANEQELDRQTSSSNLDERTLRQVYDLPVEIAVAQSDPASVMCSYNQVNGVYMCENPILTTNLKQDMGFSGYVVSDFGAVHSTAAALNAGLDQELNRPRFFTPELLDAALDAGEITQERIDEAAMRVVTSYIQAGLFDTPLPETPVEDASTAQHTSIAREAAEQGTVLLKNDGALPLAPDADEQIAVIGATASIDATDGVSASSVCSMNWRGGNTLECEDLVSGEAAIRDRAAEVGAEVVFDDGSDPVAAAELAADSDTAVVFGYRKMGEFDDAPDLTLENDGDALVAAVAAANPETIVVLNTGSAVEMPWLGDTAAVLEAWYSGEQGGPALAAILFGDVNPSGKLPMTFPVSLADTPTAQSDAQYPGVFEDGSTTRPDGSDEIRQVEYSEGLEVGYKWYDEEGIDPLFEFGFGLSYTSFAYSDLAVDRRYGGEGVSTTVAFTVENSGEVAGTEIPQVYLTLPESAEEPGRRLVGFDRIELAPGESRRVEVVIDSSASNHPYEIWDTAADAWQMAAGEFGVDVAASSRDIRLSDVVAVVPDTTAPEVSVSADPATPDGETDWYVSPVSVQATATDDRDAAPSIEVDVDGVGWVPFADPLTVAEDGEHTLRFRAVDAAGNVSETVEWAGALDASPPDVAAAWDGLSVSLQASDATSGVAALEVESGEMEGWMAYEGAIELAPQETLRYRARDVAGNLSEISEVLAPASTLSLDPATAQPGERVTVAGENIPEGDYTLVMRSSPVTVATATVGADATLSASFRVPADASVGSHRVQVVGPDGAVLVSAALTVEAEALAVTGGSFAGGWIAAGALLLVLLGAAALARHRTRRI